MKTRTGKGDAHLLLGVQLMVMMDRKDWQTD